MKTIMIFATAAFSILPFVASAADLYVAIDLSGSNPLIADDNYSYVASNYVAEMIGQMKSGGKVHVQTFGARSASVNMLNQTYEISHHVRPRAVAAVTTQFIRSLPKRKDISQGATEILGWLELHSNFECGQGTRILLLTDGLESSSAVQAQKFAEGKMALPKPDVSLSGCSLTFFGLGAGLPTPIAKNIRAGWESWATSAGASFHAVIP